MKVRTTMQPHREVEVDEAELLDLRRQGVLIEDDPKDDKETDAKAKAPAKKEV